MHKTLVLFTVIILTIPSLLILPLSSATTKPSVPEFTVTYINNSYYIPSTSANTTDPFTGRQTVTFTDGDWVDKRTIAVRIKNEPFLSDVNSNTLLYYNLRFRGHFEETWHDIYWVNETELRFAASIPHSNEDISFLLSDLVKHHYGLFQQTTSGQYDFQVQAFIGSKIVGSTCLTGETSDWSSTQTITIGAISSNISTSASSSPSTVNSSEPYSQNSGFFGLGWIGVAAAVLLFVVLLVFVVFYLRKRSTIGSRKADVQQTGS